MPLPKLNTITYQLVLPSTDQAITYRPFTVEEEKILLTAQESTEAKDILQAMRQIVNNCVQTPIDVMKMATFDLEYFFLNIRAKSTGEEIELLLKHRNSTNSNGQVCEHKQIMKISIDEVKVHKSENHQNRFQLDENVGVQLRYPTFEAMAYTNNNDEFEQLIELIANSIEMIYDKDGVYNAEDSTIDELRKFVYSMNQKQIAMIQEFFETMPVLKHEVAYKCTECGCLENVEIRGFQNFFL